MRKHSLYVIFLLATLLTISGTGYSQGNSFIRTKTLQVHTVAPGFSEIGPVATNLWTFNALNVYDLRLKTHVFYITSFNSASRGQLIRLDYRDNRAKSWTLPVGIGSNRTHELQLALKEGTISFVPAKMKHWRV